MAEEDRSGELFLRKVEKQCSEGRCIVSIMAGIITNIRSTADCKMSKSPEIIESSYLLPQGKMKYVSPEQFMAQWRELTLRRDSEVNGDDEDDFDQENFLETEKAEVALHLSVLEHISFWFTIIGEFNDAKHIPVHMFSLALIQKYIQVIYAIDSFNHDDDSDIFGPSKFPSIDEYTEIYFPGASKDVSGNLFVRHEEFWHIRFGGIFKVIKDYKGMEVIDLVLANPGKPMHILDLQNLIFQQNMRANGGRNLGENTESESNQHSKNIYAEFAINKLSPRPRAKGIKLSALAKQAKELSNELGSACVQRKIEIIAELKSLAPEMADLGPPTDAEIMYKRIKGAVSKNLSDVKKYLKVVFPELHEHLNEYLYNFNYTPEKGVVWRTSSSMNMFLENISNRTINFIDE